MGSWITKLGLYEHFWGCCWSKHFWINLNQNFHDLNSKYFSSMNEVLLNNINGVFSCGVRNFPFTLNLVTHSVYKPHAVAHRLQIFFRLVYEWYRFPILLKAVRNPAEERCPCDGTTPQHVSHILTCLSHRAGTLFREPIRGRIFFRLMVLRFPLRTLPQTYYSILTFAFGTMPKYIDNHSYHRSTLYYILTWLSSGSIHCPHALKGYTRPSQMYPN